MEDNRHDKTKAFGSKSFDALEDRTLLDELLTGKHVISQGDELFCQQYVEQLSSFGLSKLAMEPEHLKEEQKNILEETQRLAFENYQTFIQAAQCSKDVSKDFNIVDEHLNTMMDNLPLFTSSIEEFAKSSQEINSSRKQNSLVLSRHTQLLEILEISQLMDTCVRNGYYEEALELSIFVKRLEKKFTSIKIITDIGAEVKRSTQLMLDQLLQQLKGSIQLPACLRIISYIRQLDVFGEAELRITFLQARDSWFKNVISQIPKDDAYNHLTKVIDASRVNLFDIITQYKAIFSDDEPTYTIDEEKKSSYSAILRSWVLQKISEFMRTLHEDVHRGLGGRLDSVYGQCMYFGLSFSRIGADFRGAMIAIFHRYTLKQFKQTVNNATCRFEDDIGTFTVSSKSFKRLDTKNVKIDPVSPPHELLEFPPLAIYLNGVLMALNDLRQYPALPFIYKVKDTLSNSLEKVMLALEKWARLESQSQPDRNDESVKTLCVLVLKYFLPYVEKAFKLFFDEKNIHKMVGRLPNNVNVVENKTELMLDVTTLNNHLRDYVDVNALLDEVTLNEPVTGVEDVIDKSKTKEGNISMTEEPPEIDNTGYSANEHTDKHNDVSD
ncbi:conserved oligomeric Golgi complex subunit 8-like isoform X2 [Hydractinia symbiolongicarpus]|uniref:conserved oligomeric Golgi complex subunit 8-like isoform X2 n=1 Tax=Hydractinia symbiolongicarpus TaxID=13093 RepID=UPI00254DA86A|nr:conserved oligomeric Golgi complex subunit 8-like isoform X2 [Hydractinia symbiolongicarpus]